jgi:hypothetical protein
MVYPYISLMNNIYSGDTVPALGQFILEGKITEFRQLFTFVTRKTLAELSGVKYWRMLMIAKDPLNATVLEMDQISRILKIPLQKIMEIVKPITVK